MSFVNLDKFIQNNSFNVNDIKIPDKLSIVDFKKFMKNAKESKEKEISIMNNLLDIVEKSILETSEDETLLDSYIDSRSDSLEEDIEIDKLRKNSKLRSKSIADRGMSGKLERVLPDKIPQAIMNNIISEIKKAENKYEEQIDLRDYICEDNPHEPIKI